MVVYLKQLILTLFTGIMEFSGVTLLNSLWTEHIRSRSHFKDYYAGGFKHGELKLHYYIPPMSLRISAILAVSASLMCLVHACTREKPAETESKKIM